MFISFEGIDRSGKSTQAALLAAALGPQAVLLREPGGTPAGERIRELIKDPGTELGPTAELMLFLAARAELATSVIAPAMGSGSDIVCDRYMDSSVAYQGQAVGRGLAGPEADFAAALAAGIEAIESLNATVVGPALPDLTLLIRVDADRAAERGQSRLAAGLADGGDRFEGRGLAFQRAVAAVYDELSARHPGRIAVIDGEGEPGVVHERVLAALERARR